MSNAGGSWESMILAEIQNEVDALVRLARLIIEQDRIGGSRRRYDELVSQLEQRIREIPEQARDRVLVRVLGAFALHLEIADGR
ncbi:MULTISPECIES: hypothetical protein [Microbacterium]|uniref:Uncharacterized protein n=1 Tax=Microbacterium maritypicum MF109 TaxID=1333857 RepID=T5K645_MICMQ|nr:MULTISPECIES: hypothetical protein [Microbacterium]EQM75934.1 hypothetical protein L687_18665 [Microbacterium maritypicum MF109]